MRPKPNLNPLQPFRTCLMSTGKLSSKRKSLDCRPKSYSKRMQSRLGANGKFSDIKRRHIVILLDSIAKRAPITRNRVHGALSRIFNFAAERGVIDDSPCTRIKKLPEKGRNRVLSNEEIKSLWAALGPGQQRYRPLQVPPSWH